MNDKLKSYPKTEMFEIVDTICVPHPYCITSKHVVYSSDHYGGILDKRAIEEAEKHGAKCGVRGCRLKYDEHETALVVQCSTDKSLSEIEKELEEYLLSQEMENHGGFLQKTCHSLNNRLR